MKSGKEMTTGAVFPQILQFTLPLLLGNMLVQTYSMADAAIVGKFLGIGSLAAVGASSSVIFLILGFCNGTCAGFGIPVAQKFGARDYPAMRACVWTGIRLSLWLSVSLAVVTSLLCGPILRWMETPEAIFGGAYIYLLITFAGIPATFFFSLFSCIIRALGDSRTPFWFLLAGTLLNILLDLLCIVVLPWGVAGAAVATVAAQACTAVACYVFMVRRFPILHPEGSEGSFNPRVARMMLRIGAPMGLQFSITAIGSILLQSANNALGTASVAAFTAGTRVKMFLIAPMESLGMALATFSGQNYGARRPERIRTGVLAASGMAGLYAVAVFFLLQFASGTLALLFVDVCETEIVAATVQYLQASALFFVFLGILCVLRYTIQGAGFTALAMFSGVSEMIARVAVSLWAVPAFGYAAVCYGDAVAWVAAVLFLVPAFAGVYRKLMRSVHGESGEVSN